MRTEKAYIDLINGYMEQRIRRIGEIPGVLLDAMLYSLNAGGKRFRPMLLLAACERAGGRIESALPFACALEMIHTYSLIHDDLPGMDNDDLRRGKPTNHVVFGEGMAILAGDGLLNGAMEIVLSECVQSGERGPVLAAAALAGHAGITGMIAGQAMDISAEENMPPDEKQITYIHLHKTSDLIQAPMEMGMILAGAGEAEIRAGGRYGCYLGLAFQIIDDILDVTGNPALMGKNTGMDDHKMTWVALKGLEQAKRDAADYTRKAVEALKALPWDTGFFQDIAGEYLSRLS